MSTAVKYGKLSVESSESEFVTVQCDCGSPPKQVRLKSLKSGAVRGCGCLRGGVVSHGMSGTPIYKVWSNMLNRTTGNSHAQAEKYNRLGVCDSWLKFENFYSDMGDIPFEGASLDRKDNSLGYSKDNCQWATREAQQNNRTNTVFLTVSGIKKPLTHWARESGISESTLRSRLNLGIPVEKAVKKDYTKAVRSPESYLTSRTRRFTNGLDTKTLTELANKLGVSKSTMHWRVLNKKDLNGYKEIT